MNLGSGPAHISADALAGSSASGHVFYTGRARLWQGDSVLDANQIEVWRDDKKLQATGNVTAVFPQSASSPIGTGFGMPVNKPAGKVSAAGSAPAASPSAATSKASPTVWVIHAPSLTYWDDQSKARLEGGVTATSQQGELTSKTLDAYLGPAPPAAGAKGALRTGRCQRQLREAASSPASSLRGKWSSGRAIAGAPRRRRFTPPRTRNSCFPAANPRLLMRIATQPRAIR